MQLEAELSSSDADSEIASAGNQGLASRLSQLFSQYTGQTVTEVRTTVRGTRRSRRGNKKKQDTVDDEFQSIVDIKGLFTNENKT